MSKPYTWNLSELYSGLNDPQIEADLQNSEAVVTAFANKWRGRTDYLKDPAVLREALDELEALNRDIGTGSRVSYYLTLSRAIDQSNSELKGFEAVVEERMTNLASKKTFFGLSLGKIDPDVQQIMLESEELAPYRVWLKRRFEHAVHDFSEETENVLRHILPQASSAWESMVEELLSESSARVFTGKKKELVPFNGLANLLSSSNLRVIDEAGAGMARVMKKVAPIAEREINAIVTTNIRYNKQAKYDRVDAASFLGNDLDAEIVDTLLNTVSENFSIAHEFFDLKSQLLGIDTFEYHQRNLKYGTLPEGFSFEKACDMIRDMLGKLHPDFVVEFDRALADGHIDVFPRLGKRGGAACWHNKIDHPTYLMLNHTGSLDDVQTGAHEFGHYLNNLHMQTGGLCDSLTFGATTPMAEVASMFFEKYILDAILAEANDEERLAILMAYLQDEIASIFRQGAMTMFEQELYAQVEAEGYLSYQQIGQLFNEHMSAYLGPRVSMAGDAHLGWVYVGHFRYEFYMYGYVFAMLVAKALQTRVDADPQYINEFRRLLSTGMSQTSRDLLMSMGLDVSNESVWMMGLNQLSDVLQETKQLAKKLGKI